MLRLSNLLRGCYREPSSNPPTLGRFVLTDATDQYGQAPLSATTVFNFFEPDYSLPGPLVEAGLYSPEFQIVTELTSVDMANHLFDGIRYGFSVRSDHPQGIGIDLTALESRAADGDLLVDYLEKLFVGRVLDTGTRTQLKAAASIYADSPTEAAKAVLQILVASPEFAIQK